MSHITDYTHSMSGFQLNRIRPTQQRANRTSMVVASVHWHVLSCDSATSKDVPLAIVILCVADGGATDATFR